jgi:hypothetical protein
LSGNVVSGHLIGVSLAGQQAQQEENAFLWGAEGRVAFPLPPDYKCMDFK